MAQSTQVTVLGAGPGGYAAAFYAADLGMEVTLIDEEKNPGGVCLYRGCIPSKALLHVAKVVDEAKAPRFTMLAPVKDRAKLKKSWELVNKHSPEEGGWWNFLTALVGKYGVLPLSAMPETKSSSPPRLSQMSLSLTKSMPSIAAAAKSA